jgi:hypothetical protein
MGAVMVRCPQTGRDNPTAALKLLSFLAPPGRYPRTCLTGARW